MKEIKKTLSEFWLEKMNGRDHCDDPA